MAFSIPAAITYEDSSQDYNCFCSLKEADTYHGRRLANDQWRGAEEDSRMSVIFNATDILHRQDWVGTPTSYDQNLAFPRQYIPNRISLSDEDIAPGSSYFDDSIYQGYQFLDANSIPQFVKDATAELANFLLLRSASGKDEMSQYSDQISGIKLGKLNIQFREENNYITDLPYQVLFMIRDFLKSVKETDSSLKQTRNIQLQRP